MRQLVQLLTITLFCLVATEVRGQVAGTIAQVQTEVNTTLGATAYLAGDKLTTYNDATVTTGQMDANDTYEIHHNWIDANGTSVKFVKSTGKVAGGGTTASWTQWSSWYRVPTVENQVSSQYICEIEVAGLVNGTIASDTLSAIYNIGG